MHLTVYVKPGSRKEYVKQQDATTWLIAVREPARDGRANEAVREALSEALGMAKTRLSLVSGAQTRIKRFVVNS